MRYTIGRSSILITLLFLLFGVAAQAQVVASFTASTTSGCEPLTVHFTNTSTDASDFVWDFGNGSSSILTDDDGVYLSAGTYTVVLTASNSVTLTSDTETMVITVNAVPPVITGTPYVCIAATRLLFDAMPGGTWSSANTTVASVDDTGLVTGVTAGTASILYTSAAGCSTSVNITVLPQIPPITGPNSVCTGGTTTLFNTKSGGTWSSSDTTIAKVTSAGVVSGIKAGLVAINYIAALTCDIATKTLTVIPTNNAGVLSGKSVLCIGEKSQLSSTMPGSKKWFSSDASYASIDTNGVVTGHLAGSATISYYLTTSCGSALSTKTVLVNPSPVAGHISIHSDTVLCSNTLFQNFGADTTEPVTGNYIWTATNADIYSTAYYTKRNALVSFHTPGLAVVRLTTIAKISGCGSVDSFVVRVRDIESPSPDVFFYAGQMVCSDRTADAYQWGFDNSTTLDSTIVPGAIRQNYTFQSPKIPELVWVMTKYGTCSQKSYYIEPLAATTIGSKGKSVEILLVPNPADNIINIELKGIDNPGKTTARLLDVTGKEIKTIEINGTKGTMQLDSTIPGMYMIAMEHNGTPVGSKLFIKK